MKWNEIMVVCPAGNIYIYFLLHLLGHWSVGVYYCYYYLITFNKYEKKAKQENNGNGKF